MVSVQVFSKSSGAPQQSIRVGISVGIDGVSAEYTNSNGEAHFASINPGTYDVYVNGNLQHHGRVEGRLVLYV